MKRLTALAASLLVSSTVAAQSYQWAPGLDVIIPVYTDTTKDGGPGPIRGWLGYDRDTGRASQLVVSEGCYTAWSWHPTAGNGAITAILQVDARTFALYHDSGHIRLETPPDVLLCTPL